MAKKKEVKTNIIKTGITNYPVGDFLIRVKNAALARRKEVLVRKTKLVDALANALKKEGFLDSVSSEGDLISVSLAYRRKEPVILDIKLVSKPGQRRYMGVEDLAKIKNPSIFFISTPKGVISSREAIKNRVGGEVIVEVW